MSKFKLVSEFTPKGDQPQAIDKLSKGVLEGEKHQALLGVTGSGKTFTMANVIARVNKPTLVIAPNKTLAAQLYGEFKELFPENAVEYFVSYYDYYQPEAYIPSTDTFIEKDASINEELDKLRHSATKSVLERKDVIVVASVSCIYGLGSPEDYYEMMLFLRKNDKISRDEILSKLVEIQYTRNDFDLKRGTFRVRGDIIEIFPPYEEKEVVRIELFGDIVDSIYIVDPLRGKKIRYIDKVAIYPETHYVAPKDKLKRAIASIREELKEHLKKLESENKLVEMQRIRTRTLYDLELMEEIGYCKGIENYSRHLDGRKEGEPPATLLNYFPKDFLIIIDESHVTIPQLQGMYRGDRSRKENLVEHGFRLPSAYDNRPLKFDEFNNNINQVIYVSATLGDYELEKAGNVVVEQIIRPTGLIDPKILVKNAENQIDDLLEEIRIRVSRNERVLVTTLTKNMAEELTEYYKEIGIRVNYLHSDIDTITRTEIIRDLRAGKFDVLIGINLLREGLDIPEVSLVAILDADKEGFLRSERSLIQTCGRASRNIAGEVIMYADKITKSMELAIKETERRRIIQQKYNEENGITPESIKKSIKNILETIYEADYYTVPVFQDTQERYYSLDEILELIEKLKKEMKELAKRLEFEKAAEIRDKIKELEKKFILQ